MESNELGMVGLGRMGANMSERLINAGHEVVGFDLNPDAVATLAAAGGTGIAIGAESGSFGRARIRLHCDLRISREGDAACDA